MRKWLEFERLLGKLPSVGGLLTDVPVAEVWSTVRWEEGPCQKPYSRSVQGKLCRAGMFSICTVQHTPLATGGCGTLRMWLLRMRNSTLILSNFSVKLPCLHSAALKKSAWRGQDDKTTGFKNLAVKIHKPVKMNLYGRSGHVADRTIRRFGAEVNTPT